MISSAVAVPEQPPQSPAGAPTSPSRKRRQSSQSASDSNKRPRLETAVSNVASNHRSPPASATAMSPPRRKSSLFSGGVEEKKRGQRLFGGLLNALSHTSTKPVHKKRDEIEQRQRERLKYEDEQRDEERRVKREELDRVRQGEQKRWQEESLKVKHRNIRSTAGYLQTKTEPKLYYRPWEMTKDEEALIQRQNEEVEEQINRELEERKQASHRVNNTQDQPQDDPVNGANEDHVEHPGEEDSLNGTDQKRDESDQPSVTGADAAEPSDQAIDESNVPEERPKDDGADDLVDEGHDEDQVIY